MNNLKKIDFNVRQICLTAYKSLLLLKYLLIMPLSRDEIIDLFNEDCFISHDVSLENIRVIINSLKELGCIISKPDSKHNYKYELLKNPFSLNLTREEVLLINRFRQKFIGGKKFELGLAINSFVNKLCLMISDSNTKEGLLNHNIISEIRLELIEQLKECCKNNNVVILEYLSGKTVSNFEMETSFLKYEKNKLYIWGYSPKYKDFSYLRVDKIKSVKVIDKKPQNVQNKYIIRYKTFNPYYFLDENEVLIDKNDKEMTIDYYSDSQFHAIQKFLELGTNCKILSPKSFKDNFIKTLKDIKEVYKDG